MKKKLNTLLLLFIFVQNFFSQTLVTSAGGVSVKGKGGSFDFVIGQTLSNTNVGSSGTEFQGVLQSTYEIKIISDVDPSKLILLSCSVYPNPTTNYFILKVLDADKFVFHATLFDINGKMLFNKVVVNTESPFSLQDYLKGNYLLNVYKTSSTYNEEKQVLVKQFKIIKK